MSNEVSDILGKAREIARTAWLTTLGAGGTAYDKASALVAEKVFGKKPSGGAAPASGGAKGFSGRVEQFTAKGAEVEVVLKEQLVKGKESLEGGVEWARKNLNIDVINREQELARINERLEELTRKVDTLEKKLAAKK